MLIKKWAGSLSEGKLKERNFWKQEEAWGKKRYSK